MKYYLAIDIGASSGRHIIGYFDNNQMVYKEIYRFKNEVKLVNNHLIWDIDELVKQVKLGIQESLKLYPNIESLSIDTWGVDYALLNGNETIYPVYAYRDTRTEKAINEVHKIIPFERLYEITGSQFQVFNSIYQLYKDKMDGRLDKATDFLMIPEYIIYKLTNKKVKEFTNGATTGLYDCKTLKISDEIINKLGFPDFVKHETYKPGHVVGDLSCDVQKEVNGNIKVVLCATHDTASAVEGIEMESNAPYISSGTWSLLGIKNDVSINTLEAMQANYSNEFGKNYIRVQKNIMGLWIIQCLAKQTNLDFAMMVELAKTSNYKSIYDVNDKRFLSSLDMKTTIVDYFKEKNQDYPKTDADLINSTYHSLAYSYKVALEELERITNKKYQQLYIVGGGAKNNYLNELTKKYTNKEIIALPIEATSVGNIKMQMEADNEKTNN